MDNRAWRGGRGSPPEFIIEIVGSGPRGKDGLSPSIGDNGNWWIGDTDTGVSAMGAGAPQIGENGNWFVDGEDTGVPATGPKGKDGESGKSPYIGENGNWFTWDGEQFVDTGVFVGGNGGTVDHRLLENRDAEDSHPMGAITGLDKALTKASGDVAGLSAEIDAINRELSGTLSTDDAMSYSDIYEIISK